MVKEQKRKENRTCAQNSRGDEGHARLAVFCACNYHSRGASPGSLAHASLWRQTDLEAGLEKLDTLVHPPCLETGLSLAENAFHVCLLIIAPTATDFLLSD